MTAEDAIEFIMAGASAIQVGSGNFIKPDIALDIIDGIEEFMILEGLKSLDEIMTIKRGFEIKEGQRVLIAEDVVTTGKSAYEAIKVVEDHGGIVVAIGCLADRTSGHIKYPLYAASKLQIETYELEDCPLCKEGLEIQKPGSRKI